MPYEVRWYIENRVIHDRVYGEVIPEDAIETSHIITQRLREQPALPLVHLVVDLRDMTKIPILNLNKLNQSLVHMKEKNLGWTLLVSTNALARFLASMLTQVARVRFRSFSQMDEALIFLSEVDSSLSDVLAEKKLS